MYKPRIKFFAMSRQGKGRSVNDDQFLIADLKKAIQIRFSSLPDNGLTDLVGMPQGKLLLVADGIGQGQSGRLASSLTVTTLIEFILSRFHWLLLQKKNDMTELNAQMKAALMECQKLLERDIQSDSRHEGIATTLTLAYLVWPHVYIIHVGNCRFYLLQNETLTRVTKDHTLSLFPRSSQSAPSPTVLTNVIGAQVDTNPDFDLYEKNLNSGDRLLLCTDGLTNSLSDHDIELILKSGTSPEKICQDLLTKVELKGGDDNSTVIVANISKPGKQKRNLAVAYQNQEISA